MKSLKKILVICVNLILVSNFSVYADGDPKVTVGGALRFNYNYSDWNKQSQKNWGQFGYDVFRINARASYYKLSLDAEYRFYTPNSGGPMLKHGWIAYQFNPEHQLQLGLNTVPFGILPYNSNNWFFNINYYLGLEDDADMGLKYSYRHKNWDFDAAFYKNSDIVNFFSEDGISASRYGYDIAGRNKEINQGNLRVAYRYDGFTKHELGASGQIGGVYNIDSQQTALRTAFAFHYVFSIGNLNLKAQYTNFDIAHKNAETIQTSGITLPNPDANADWVEMAAYGSNYNVARQAQTYTVGVSFKIPLGYEFLDAITVYNDWGMLHKHNQAYLDSYQNVTGVMFTAGPIYAYLDYAMGKNHAWLGGDWTNSFAAGGDDRWHARTNLNIGYYF